MITKVNRPPHLALVSSSKQTENDPGSSQGGSNAYDAPKKEEQKQENHDDLLADPELKIVSELEKSGMTEVVTEFYEHKKKDSIVPAPGLTTRYQSDVSPTKGLLLNKKAE